MDFEAKGKYNEDISSSGQDIDLDDFDIVDECLDRGENELKSSIFCNLRDASISKSDVNNFLNRDLERHTCGGKLDKNVVTPDTIDIKQESTFSSKNRNSEISKITESSFLNEEQIIEETENNESLFVDIENKKQLLVETSGHSLKKTKSLQKSFDNEQENKNEKLLRKVQNNELLYEKIEKEKISSFEDGIKLESSQLVNFKSHTNTDDRNVRINSKVHQSDDEKTSGFEIDLDDLFIVDSTESEFVPVEKGESNLKSHWKSLDNDKNKLPANLNEPKDVIIEVK